MRDPQVAAALASINTKLESIDTRLTTFEEKLDGVVSTINRWKGAIALLGALSVMVYYLSGMLGKFVTFFKT